MVSKKIFFSTQGCLHLACFKIDCLTPLDRVLKRKVSLTCAQTRVWLLRIEIVRRSIVSARLEGFGCYLVLIGVVSIFFVYTDMAVVFAANCLRHPLKELLIMAEFEIEYFDAGK